MAENWLIRSWVKCPEGLEDDGLRPGAEDESFHVRLSETTVLRFDPHTLSNGSFVKLVNSLIGLDSILHRN